MLKKSQLNPCSLMCYLRLLFPCWFSIWKIYPLITMSVKVPYYDGITVHLFFHACQYLLFIFSYSFIMYINVYKGDILLLDCSLYHYEMSFLVSYYSLCFKMYFVWYDYCHPSMFFTSIWMIYVFPLFIFSLCVSFYMKWVSTCRQLCVNLVFLSTQLPYVTVDWSIHWSI